jgi:serine/threonine protein kinase
MTVADYPTALPPRHTLLEYRIERVLGHGGFGITYVATDTTLRKTVAIKEYLPAQLAVRSEGATVMPRTRRLADDYRWGLERFLDEARTLARFRHRNIVPVLRFFESNGTAYIVMEYEDGRSLAELLAGPGRLPAARVRALIDGLLDGLEQVHAAGFLHRDIKPSNVIVRGDGAPVLIDFGAARQALLRGGATLTSIVTPRYAPLEQYQADAEQGPWTDIYAMAAVAYHAITGEAPPEAPGRVRHDSCRRLAESEKPGYGAAFLAAIDHGLAVHPEERPQTIAAWRESMGSPPVIPATFESLAEPTPAAAQTRLMQAPLTQGRDGRGAGTGEPPPALRLGGADGSDRVRPAAPPRRTGSARPIVLAAIAAVVVAGGVLAWQGGGPPSPPETPPATADSAPAAPPPSAEPPAPTSPAPPSPPAAREPVPIRPPVAKPPSGTLGSIDELLDKTVPAGPQPASASGDTTAARDRIIDAARQVATQAVAAAELAEQAHQRALARAGDARITAAEAGKPDLQGRREISFDDGSTYAGQLVGGQRSGLGVAELTSGERQAGEWRDNRLEGLGVLRAADGRGYEGEWRAGLPDGLGVLRLGPAERYFGEIKGGQPAGAGVRTVKEGSETITRAGTWRNGLLEGPGVESLSSGWRYEGAFHEGKRHGPGMLVAPDGTRFHGTFVAGTADGYGVSVSPDGRMSSGDWRAGKLIRPDE